MSLKYKILLVIFFIIAAALAVWAARADSETTDESVYIAASYELLKYHDFRFNPEHPPLTKYFFAVPLGILKINEPPRDELLQKTNDYYYNGFWEIYQYGNKMLYGSGNDADEILFWARFSSIVFMILLGVIVFAWSKELFGLPAAFFSTLLYLFNPLILAMGHYATPDMGSALTFILALYLFWRYLKSPDISNLILVGVGLGLAILSRFSSLSLIILFAGWLIYQAIKEKNVWSNFKHLAAILIIAFVVLWLGYGAPIKGAPLPNEKSTAITVGETANGRFNRIFHQYAHDTIPAYFFKGFILNTYLLKSQGLMSFIDGKYSENGFWYYFPFAFLYKTPIYVFIFILVLLGLLIKYPKRYWRMDNIYLLSAIFLFMALAMMSKMDLGVRYILPVYIILFILLGQIVLVKTKIDQMILWGILLAGIIYTMGQISPKYLTYFNEFAGGPQNGWRHLSDSNLDWGQDVKRLSQYLQTNHIQNIHLQYLWKKEPLDDEKINYKIFDPQKDFDGYLVIDTSYLLANQWLFDRHCQLLSRLGNSLYVFDLRTCAALPDQN